MVSCKRWLAGVSSFFILTFLLIAGLTSDVHAQTDIGLSTLQDSMDPVQGGTDFSYVLQLYNYGDQAADNTRLTLPIPKTLKFISVSPSGQCSYKNELSYVECDFGSLPVGAKNGIEVQVVVRPVGEQTQAITLTATASTSSVELITNNNKQSETTNVIHETMDGIDIAITRLEESVGVIGKNVRSYDIIIKNIGSKKSVGAKLIVMLPSVLKYHSTSADNDCEFDVDRGRLSCQLATLEPLERGGEEFALQLNLLDATKTRGAVKIKAVIMAKGEDIVADSDAQELVVTLGAGGPKPFLLAEIDTSPVSTAALGDPVPVVPAAGGGGGIITGTGELFGNDDVFNSITSGVSGGNVDFQIQSFETNPDEVPAGSNFTLNTELINNGPGIANNTILKIIVPAGVAFVSGPGSCIQDGNPPTGPSLVTCSFGNIASGGTQSVPVIFKAVVAGRTVPRFSALIGSSSDETNINNNDQNVNFTISDGADLLLAINGAPNPAVAGGNVTYALTVTNQGLNIAQGASVTFNLPPGISFVAAGSGGDGWNNCSAVGQVVTCSRGANIAATNGTSSFNIVGLIGVGSGTYTASGSVTSTTTPDVNGSNNGATFDLTVQPGTDLSVVKTVSDNPVKGGSQPSFTITVTNHGPITAQNLVLTDNLPVGFAFVSAIGAGWACPAPVGQLVTCTRASMAVGNSDVVITVNAPASAGIPEAGQNIINSAHISSDTNDAVAGNDTGSVNFRLERDGVDLALVNYTRSPSPVAQGSNITSRFRVSNNGPRNTTGVFGVTLELQAGESYQSVSGAGWSFVSQVGNLIKFQYANNINSGAVSNYITVTTTANVAATLTAIACTSTDAGYPPPPIGDPVAANNCVSRGVASTADIADLVVSKGVAPGALAANADTITYSLTVRNDGPDQAVNVRLTDTINAYIAAYDGRPATTILATPSQGSCSISSGKNVTCDLNDIAKDDSVTVSIAVSRPMKSGAIGNVASAFSLVTGDNNRNNNTATINVDIEAVADLKLRSAVWSPSPVMAGVEAIYVITFRNSGPSSAKNITLQSQFVGDFTFISAVSSKGSCQPFGSVVANHLDCDIGTMAYGNQQTVTVRLRPNHDATPPAPWQVTNSSSVATTTTESDLTNNGGGTSLSILPAQIDLAVEQTDLVDPVGFTPGVPADNLITYRVNVSNTGPSFATGVTFIDKFTPPAGAHRLKFVCDKAAAGDVCVEATAGQICNNQGLIANGGVQESISCVIGDMAANTSVERYLMYEVLDTPIAGGETHQKIVTISANENDPVPANDLAEEQTTVRIRTDMAVTCAVPPVSVSIRQPFNLQYTVANNGPGASQITTFSQTLPNGMRLTSAPGVTGGGTCSGGVNGTAFSCDLGNVINTASETVTVPVRFTTIPAGGNYTLVANVTTNEVDRAVGNNSCTSAQGSVVNSSISGQLYQDNNDDGDRDGGEPLISFTRFRLTGIDAYGNNVSLDQNNNSGQFSFTNLSPAGVGGYTITQLQQPVNLTDGQENAGGGAVVVNSHNTDVIPNIVLAAGEDKTNYDFGELPTDIEVVSKTPSAASVSLLQPFDYTIVVRNNGPAIAPNSILTDPLPAGMELTGTPTTTVGTCTGVAGGTTPVCNLGTLAVGASATITLPVKVTVVPDGGNLSNTARVTTDNIEFNIANNEKSANVTITKSSISCVVYQDLNDGGTKDGGEPGIGGVAVTLSGRDAFGNAVNLTQNTLPNGSCLFDNLSPPDGNGYVLSEVQPVAFNDGQDNNGGNPSVTGADRFTKIALAPNTAQVNFQFGELPEAGLSGTVWCDDNNNGAIDGSEALRMQNVAIRLTGADALGAVDRSETTDANGYYHFANLRPSVGAGYTLTQTQKVDHICNLPGLASNGSVDGAAQGTPDNANGSASYGNVISNISIVVAGSAAVSYNFGELQPATLAGVVFNDTNRNDARDNGEPAIEGVEIALSCTDYRDRPFSLPNTQTAVDGSYSFTGILPTGAAGCTISETQPSDYEDGADFIGTVNGTANGVLGADEITAITLVSGATGINYNFAERSAGLSGYVYVDTDNDGVFDGGEQPIAGVTIELSGSDANGAVSRTTTTDNDGYYLFTGLSASVGDGYTVKESTQPIAWADGKDTAGSLGGTVVNDQISDIVLLAASFAVNYNFGELGGSLAGVVYTDLNNNGQQDGTESGIPGVTLNLTCTDVNATGVAKSATTGADGRYSFKDLPATDATGCAISEIQPADTTDGKDRIGSLGGTLGNDNLSAIPIAPGDDGTGYDFGEVLTNPATIAGTVWLDSNHDRSNNEGNPQIGWTVELVNRNDPSQCLSTHDIIATQITNAQGDYKFEGVSPGTYGIIFRSPTGGYLYAGTQSGDDTGQDIACGIGTIIVGAGDDIIAQDLPLDPSGVVYNSLTRAAVPGATVSISGPAGFNAASHLVGGVDNLTQTTGADGYYQFLLFAGAPSGDYNLSVGQPAGYVPQDSAIIPACSNVLNVGQFPTPALVQSSDIAPTLSAIDHVANSCPTTSAGLAPSANSTQYFFTFNLDPGLPSGNVVNNHIPLDPVSEGAFTVAKTTPKVNVSIGHLVPYTITASNNLSATLPNIELEDQIPPGFKYKRGSATLDGVRFEPVINGRQLTWTGLTFTPNQKRTIRLLMIVGSGVSEGDYINKAWAENGIIQALASNVATARVRVTADPTFDCAGVIGKVFDDRNRNGYQDSGEKGLANVRLATVRGLLVRTDKYGRYHVACADVPNPDRGSNFILKLDHRSLPSGYRLTTENPRVIRLTRGKIGKLNFGVAIHRVVRLDVTRAAFTQKGDQLKRAWQGGISRLVNILDRGPSILRIAYARGRGENARAVRTRINIIKRQVKKLWRRKRRRVLVIEIESYLSARGSSKGGSFK